MPLSQDPKIPPLRDWWPLAVWAVVVVAVAAWLWASIERDRDEGMALAEARSQALADLGGEHVLHLMESAEASVKVIMPLFRRAGEWSRLDGDMEAWLLLRDFEEAQPSIPVLFLADETGRFRLHSSALPAPAKSVADRAYFAHHRDGSSERLHVSETVVGKVTGLPSLILSRRLAYPDGRFAGLAGANLDPAVIADFFSNLGLGEGSIINLQRGDGTILVRHPFLAGAVGAKVDNRKAFPEIAAGAERATRITISPLDGIKRVTSFRRLKEFDVVVLVAIPVEWVLAPWRHQALRVALVAGSGLVGLTLLLALLLRHHHAESRALARLRVSEANLLQAQEVARLGYYLYDMVADRWESSAILDDIFGIGPDYRRTGEGWLALVAPSMRGEMAEYLHEILDGQHDFDHEYPILRHSDGAERWVWGLGRIERDGCGRPVRLVGTIRDITERKVAETALHAKAAELARSNTELEQFAYVASHDLREPLRMVSSYVELLERRYGERLDEQAREFIGFARDGARRMDRLVLDLLEYSRIGRITRPMAMVSLDKVLDRAVKALGVKTAEAGARIERPDPPLPEVWGDGEELARLLLNLIGNAVKYRDADRPPVVRVSVRPVSDGVEIEVADNGIGIDPQYFERIFLIFQRLHRRGEFEGTGIGLAICKKIVEHHGGRIGVESAPGAGSVFRVWLPASEPAKP